MSKKFYNLSNDYLFKSVFCNLELLKNWHMIFLGLIYSDIFLIIQEYKARIKNFKWRI